ncbi:MAG: DUF368 domain-containing protein [Clostridia bacterium]|nr:DUF368 domain-containing protein [Clostridia bacterium]
MKEMLISIFVGFSIGLSVIVPGISGSSIAIIMKVYDKLMYSFSNIFKKFKACFIFLLPILIGIVLGFGVGLILVKILLEAFPFITICFFVGLMVGTYPILFKEIKGERFNNNRIMMFVAGVLVPILITAVSLLLSSNNDLTSVGFGHYVLFLVIGVLISLTQLIPGLSATVLLMIFGYYTALMNGIGRELLSNVRLIFVYIMLMVGFVIGTLMFSKIINKLLDNFRKSFFFVICGLSIGSVVSVFFGNDCMDIYKGWTGADMVFDIPIGVLALAVGFAITFGIYWISKFKARDEKNI